MQISFPEDIIRGVFSLPKTEDEYLKAKLQRILIKNQEVIQVSLYTKQQVFHENISLNQINDYLNAMLEQHFRSLELFTEKYVYSIKYLVKENY